MTNHVPATHPKLCVDFSERDEYEVESKGWFLAQVILPDGREIKISFYDSTRLLQEINDELAGGRACFAEPNLVIVPEVTKTAMQQALISMQNSGYFKTAI